MITIRQLQAADRTAIPAIDVGEEDSRVYRAIDGQLHVVEDAWQRPRWDVARWQEILAGWDKTLKTDLLLGAYDGAQIVGVAGLRYKLTATMGQLTSLYISRTHRKQGVASQLVQAVLRLLTADGPQAIYVSAKPSIPAVNFYMHHGFRLTAEPDPFLFDLHPLDIHMVRPQQDTPATR